MSKVNVVAEESCVPVPQTKLTLVVPVYRAEDTLKELYRRITASIEPFDPNFELLLVEDCGGDESWAIIKNMAREDHRVKGIRLARNYGQHNALLCGIRAASGEVIITLDDDLQNPPEEIPVLLAKLDEGYDVIYGTPKSGAHGFLRNQASRITKLVLEGAMGAETASSVSAFRVFRTRMRESFRDYRSPNVNIDVLLTWGTTRYSSVPVRLDDRKNGESGYSFRKLINHAINMMTGFSIRPLQLSSVLGFIFATFGLLVLVFVLVRYLIIGSNVPGFTFLASLIAIFSGVQLFALGIFGEYLARMHFRSMEQPPYTVHSETGNGMESES